MNYECFEGAKMSRRSFLTNSAFGMAAAASAGSLLTLVESAQAQSSGGSGNLLVLCQLNGGLDALSFLAPFQNSTYRSRRPELALTADEVFPLSDAPELGINRQFDFFHELYELGQLAVVQQVAYPDGNGSHFESQEIYEFGVRNLSGTSLRWYDRMRDLYFDGPYSVMETRRIGNPQTYGYPDQQYHKAAQEAFGRLARLKKGGNPTQQNVLERYDQIDKLGQLIRDRTSNFESTGGYRNDFWRAAAIASAKLDTRIIKLQFGGFDTHGNQEQANANLFPDLTAQFRQFVNDLKAMDLWERTAILFYTEFGRRNEENGSPGTDHGYASHMILAGPQVNGGLHGQRVSSADMNQFNLPYYVDFRAVFSQVIREWLGFDPKPIFEIGNETFDANVGSSLFA